MNTQQTKTFMKNNLLHLKKFIDSYKLIRFVLKTSNEILNTISFDIDFSNYVNIYTLLIVLFYYVYKVSKKESA